MEINSSSSLSSPVPCILIHSPLSYQSHVCSQPHRQGSLALHSLSLPSPSILAVELSFSDARVKKPSLPPLVPCPFLVASATRSPATFSTTMYHTIDPDHSIAQPRFLSCPGEQCPYHAASPPSQSPTPLASLSPRDFQLVHRK